MGTPNHNATREERCQELREMWQDRRGRNEVLSMFHRVLPDGETPRAGMSVFDVILDHEFGPSTGDRGSRSSSS